MNPAATLAGVSACFVLSGFAALLYQTAWLRQFSIVFGTSELAVATVLAAYMAGLGAGAAIASRFINRLRRPILVYGLLEAGIAVTALAVPLLLAAASWLHVLLLGGQPEPPDSGGLAQPMYYLFVSFVILALPTGFMGATLPLLTRYAVQQDVQIGPRVAWLYGINTMGAVLGALVAAFLLLPRVGLQATVWVGVSVNFLVFLIAAALAQRLQVPRPAEPAGASHPLPRKTGRATLILPLMLFSGANSFVYEVLWTRLLSHVLGGTVYAFATMLASFLAGIAIGGLVAGRFARTREQATAAFVICQVMIGLLSAGIYSWLQTYTPDAAGLAANATLAAVVILPATLFIGATFPLAVRILAIDVENTPNATAYMYAWNTGGAIVGSILAGFFLIPMLGFEGAIRLAIIVNVGLAIFATAFINENRRLAAGATLLAAVLAVLYQPGAPYGLIDTSLIDKDRGGRALHYAVGRSATVFMKHRDGYYYLRTNGLPEAFIEPRGAPPIRHSQKWLTALPVIARPDADSMLIVGFGGGVAIEGVPLTVSEIDVVELEPEVIEANKKVSDKRRYNPLDDNRVSIVLNDARNALSLTSKTYDIIVSQPSHPWTAGASHLYTSEFVGLAKHRLSNEGVFLQWINSLFVDEALLRSLAATLLDQFSHVRLYQPAPTILLLLASDGPLEPELTLASTGRPLTDAVLHYSFIGINDVEDLLVALAADASGVRRLASGAPVNSDDNNRMAMFSRSGSDGLSPADLDEILSESDPLIDPDSWVYKQLGGLDLDYIGYRMLTGGFENRALKLRNSIEDRATGLTLEGLGLRHQGQLSLSENSLAAALAANPDFMPARYALVWRYLGQLAQNSAPQQIQDIANGLRGSAAAVVQGWSLGMARDWRGLALLDRELGKANPTDLWYPEAVKLRADWRIQGSSDAQLNQDAMRLLDRALMVAPLTDLLVIRAGAAIRIKDPYAFVETAQMIQQQMNDKLELVEAGKYLFGERDRRTMQLRIDGFLRQLESSFVEPTGERAAEVKIGFGALRTRLSQLPAS